MERQPMDQDKISANDANDKVLTSKINKHLIQLNNKNKSNQTMGKRPKQTFLQRRYTDGQKSLEEMLKYTNY